MDRLAAGVVLAAPRRSHSRGRRRSGPARTRPSRPRRTFWAQVLQEERVHRALKPDMQLGDLPLGQGDEPHPGKAQLLVAARPRPPGRGRAGRAPRPPRRRRARPGRPPGASDSLAAAGPSRSGHGPCRWRPAPSPPARSTLLAGPDLVLDRGVALQVGGITGVDGGAHRAYLPCLGLRQFRRLGVPVTVHGLDLDCPPSAFQSGGSRVRLSFMIPAWKRRIACSDLAWL